MAKARRGSHGKRALSHSVKKILRRNGASNIKCKKVKRKQESVGPQKQRQDTDYKLKKYGGNTGRRGDDVEMKEPKATAARREAHAALGKQLRQESLAKRRGISLSADAGAAAAALGGDDADGGRLDGGAAADAAERALASAPPAQRSFHRELSRVLQMADVLIEVLDARDPMGCRCMPLEDAVLQRWTSKRVVLLLNKADLVPADVLSRWLTHLRQYFPTLPFKASTQGKAPTQGRGQVAGGAAGRAEAFGADGLLQLLKNYSRSLNLKTAINVGIVGYPNVGKSSVINSLKRARAVNVGATPGVTTVAQTVALDAKVKLIDCPGIVFRRAKSADEEAEVALRNCVKVEQIADPLPAIAAILRKVAVERLRAQYDVGAFADASEFLALVALKRGKMGKGGAADTQAAARIVLHDWGAGNIRYHTEPPAPAAAVTLVGALAAGFDVPEAPRVEPAAAAGDGAAAAAPAAPAAAAAAAPAAADGMEVQANSALVEAVHGGGERGHAAKKAARQKAARAQDLSDEHSRYNLQVNRAIRKKQKTDKKKARKGGLI